MFLRSPYNYDRVKASVAAGLVCPEEESKTQQQFKEEVDINTIVERFGLTGELPQTNRMPVSGDFTSITDFHTALTAVRQAQEGFMEFPAQIRSKFRNDPGEMLRFLADPENRAEAEKLGLVKKKTPPPRDVVTAVDELAAALKPQAGGTPQGGGGRAS